MFFLRGSLITTLKRVQEHHVDVSEIIVLLQALRTEAVVGDAAWMLTPTAFGRSARKRCLVERLSSSEVLSQQVEPGGDKRVVAMTRKLKILLLPIYCSWLTTIKVD